MTVWARHTRRTAWAPAHDIATAVRHFDSGEHAEAARLSRAILERDPGNFGALQMLGVACLHRSEFAEAGNYLARAAHERPEVAEVHALLGNALSRLRQHAAAEEAFRRALALAPDHFATWNDLGVALSSQKRYQDGLACCERALALRPGFPPALHNLGRCLAALDRFEEAIGNFQAALEHGEPKARGSWVNNVYADLCVALMELGRDDDAMAACRAMLALGFDPPSADWPASLILLKFGDYATGWRKYESRYAVEDRETPHEKIRLLDLGEIQGKRILACAEQGKGDVIQFARYATMLARKGARVCVSAYEDLKLLLQALDGVEAVVTPDETPPPYDLVTPLLSLPLTFGTEVHTIPAAVPYLHPPAERLAAWRTRLGPRLKPRIGIFWWGSQHIPQRSMPVSTLAPVLNSTDFSFHALQKIIPEEDQQWLSEHAVVREHTSELTDFADTAALISLLDLVITIDTGVAHLAGALARPVWIMLPFNGDWRWLRERNDSPWYPTARLFRQAERGDWKSVVAAVAEELSRHRLGRQIEHEMPGAVAASAH